MGERVKLTEVQRRGLTELKAACDEYLRFGRSGWVKTRDLSGTNEERSATNMRSLVEIGYAESQRFGDNKQTQYLWRITDAGRRALQSE